MLSVFQPVIYNHSWKLIEQKITSFDQRSGSLHMDIDIFYLCVIKVEKKTGRKVSAFFTNDQYVLYSVQATRQEIDLDD